MKTSALFFSVLPVAHIYAQSSPYCDSQCQEGFQMGNAIEKSRWVNLNVSAEEFYSTPANVSGAKPGDLLRWQDVPRDVINTEYGTPSGMSLSRFLYMSEDIDRKPLLASAFVLLPYRRPNPKKPLNTVVWTHGTAGQGRNCAPSNNKDLWYEWQGPFGLAAAGYAVIGPDYAGLGVEIPQGPMYEAGFLHAADAAYGLIAARKALGKLLSHEWVVVGHSEGGMTAWRTNERLAMPGQENLLKAGKFIGAVAASPALRPLDLIPESIRRAAGGPIGDAVSVFFLQSLAGLFPDQFKLRDWATDLVLARIPLVNQGCLLSGRILFGGLTSEQIFRNTSWLDLPVVVDWQKRYNGAGPHALAAPMLVTQGIADPLTYANNTEWDFNQTCNAFPKSNVELLLYPGVDHNVGAQVGQADYLPWIKDRFDGCNVSKGCSIKIVESNTDHFRDVGTFFAGHGG